MKNINAITVSYNTPELIKDAVNSLVQFYHDINILIIDNSPEGSECFNVVNNLCLRENTNCFHTGYNIGHGEALQLGISITDRKYILLFDSDIKMIKPCIREMVNLISYDTYGVGEVVQVNARGQNVDKGINYLHPYFSVIQRGNYKKFNPIIHHGAPMIKAMLELNIKRGCKLIDFDLKDYIIHYGRGTRTTLNGKEAENLRA